MKQLECTNGVQELKRTTTPISANGRERICQAIRDAGLQPPPLSLQWQYRDSRGQKFAKRFNKIYREILKSEGAEPEKIKEVLNASIISKIGQLAQRNSTTVLKVYYDITQNFEWQAGDYGDRGSCFWNENQHARRMLEASDSFALRAYKNDSDWENETGAPRGYGRCWVISCNESTHGFDGYMLMNAYPEHLQLVTMARVLAEILGGDYKRIDEVYNNGHWDGVLYINGHTGYAVVDSFGELQNIRKVDLQIDDMSKCDCVECGDFYDIDGMYTIDSEYICGNCATHCHSCNETTLINDTIRTANYSQICPTCIENRFSDCTNCEKIFRTDRLTTINDDCRVCSNCRDVYRHCVECLTFESRHNMESWRAENAHFTTWIYRCNPCNEKREIQLESEATPA